MLWSSFEVAGLDMGPQAAGYVSDFALGCLTVGGRQPANVKLVDVTDNGNRSGVAEVLYVHDVVVGAGSTLSLNGLTLYYDGTLSNAGRITGGQVIRVVTGEDSL